MTGRSGFLGSNLYDKLRNKHDIHVVDRNLDISETIENVSPDIFIHVGWAGGNNYNDVNDVKQFDNVTYGVKIIETLRKLKNDVIFIGYGSFAEYGLINNPIPETEIENPINLYGYSKLALKQFAESRCKKSNVKFIWVRPCYIYGPGDIHTRLIPRIIMKCLNNEHIQLDSCQKIIDYLYVDDYSEMLNSIIDNPIENVYNICSGKQYLLKDVITKIHSIVGNNNSITFSESCDRNLTSTMICGNNTKILSHAKISELTDIEVGLRKTIDYFKSKDINEL